MTGDHAVTDGSAPLNTAHCWEDVIGDDERLAFAGYRAPRQFRSPRALLLIDLCDKVFGARDVPLREAVRTAPSSCGPAGWRALPIVEDLLSCAREAQVPVVHTLGESAGSVWGNATLRSVTRALPTGDTGPSDGDRIVTSLAPRDDEAVVRKARASAFFGTPLDAYLRRVGVAALLVAGVSTSGCVRASVVDACSLGFDVAVVEEGTFDRSPLSHKVNLFDMHCKYATVVSAGVAVDLLEDPAATMLTP